MADTTVDKRIKETKTHIEEAISLLGMVVSNTDDDWDQYTDGSQDVILNSLQSLICIRRDLLAGAL